ncbi:hypothetical protein MCETHM1_01391 [Flavobacteriaceae bacterium]
MSWYERVNWNFLITVFSTKALALIEATSPDLEKQGFLAVVFFNREYSG